MIGGNITASLQTKTTTQNEYGEHISTWEEVDTITGFLDLSGGDSKYTYNSKIEESTHIFIADYKELSLEENSRMMIGKEVYEIKYIDNPMGLNKQLEIYLSFTGGV